MKKTFRLGRLLATPAALAACETTRESPLEFVLRHARLEPGDFQRRTFALMRRHWNWASGCSVRFI